MTGKQIRQQYKMDKDLVKAISNIVVLIEQAEEQTLEVIAKATGANINKALVERGISITQLNKVIQHICQIQDSVRIEKCIYKASFDKVVFIPMLKQNRADEFTKVVCSSYEMSMSKQMREALKQNNSL